MFGVLINYDYLYGRKIEIPSFLSVNKFNAYFFEKTRKLFGGLIMILYL